MSGGIDGGSPPRALVTASRLWVAAGVLVLVLGGLVVIQALGGPQYEPLAVLFAAGLFVALGSAMISFGRGLRHGGDHRVALIVLGVLSLLFLLPPLLAIPATVLQYRRESREWLAGVRRRPDRGY